MAIGRVVAVHEGVRDGLAHCGERVVGHVLAQCSLHYRAVPHVPRDRPHGLDDHGGNRPVGVGCVRETPASAVDLALTRRRVGGEDHIQSGEELLRVLPQGEHPGKRRPRDARRVHRHDAPVSHELLVRDRARTVKRRGAHVREPALEQDRVEVVDGGVWYGHRVVSGRAVLVLNEAVYLVERHLMVAVTGPHI